MQTLVYFSNDGIQILQGIVKKDRLTITNYKTLPVEAGALINGVITNEEVFRETIIEALKESPKLFKNMKLIIDSSLILTKTVEVPKLKPRELEVLAAAEFDESAGNYDELVVDYTPISGSSSNRIFCCGIEKRVIESYVTLFGSLKIQIQSIDVGLNTMIQYVTATRDFRGMTFALNILDGKNLVSLLFENGIFIFSTRSRLLAERGTETFAQELTGKLSSLIQFNKSQKSEHPLNMSLYAGLDEFELEGLKALNFDPDLNVFALPQTPNIKTGFVMDEAFDFGSFIYPSAGFFSGSRPLNLFASYRKSNAAKKALPFEYKVLILPAAMIFVFLITFGVFFGLKYSAGKRLEEMNAYISDANNQAKYLQAKQLTDEVNSIQVEIANIETINAAINSNPDLGSAMMNSLATQGNGVITLNALAYDGTTGAIHIEATANNEKEAARYIERLKSTAYFTQVDYTGYAQVSGTQTTTTTSSSTTNTILGYGFSADAYLKAGTAQ
ncbi:type IV pilus biogenesis protein PilM [Acetobacterium wieringae]|uniref:type IV pilus biogenesis protein PilM n=1 Tax=Acetobacterium wieringae TaxID=52694 RepID=UPI00315857FD